MAQDYHEMEGVNRRGFLKLATLTAVAATATGAGAAVLRNKLDESATITAVPNLTNSFNAPPPVTAVDPSADLRVQLTSLQAENAQLRAQLTTANNQINTYETVNGETVTSNEALHLQLSEANTQISFLAGLVALYEQLDATDFSEALENGLGAVGENLNTLLADVPTLSEGLARGRQALDELDDHIPLLENGRSWLDTHTSKLDQYFQGIEQVLSTAVDAAGPFLQMFNEWVQKILKWLPFGLGEKTSTITHSINTLLQEIPATTSGLNTNIAQPLDIWLGQPQEEAPLRRNLIKPVRDDLFVKTDATLKQAQQVQNVYDTELKQPVATAVNNQRAIRTLIAQYRQQNQA